MKKSSAYFFYCFSWFFLNYTGDAEEISKQPVIYEEAEKLKILVIPEKNSAITNETINIKIILLNFSKVDKSVIMPLRKNGFGCDLKGVVYERMPNKNNNIQIYTISQSQGGSRMKEFFIKSGDFQIIESQIVPFKDIKGSGIGLFSLDVSGTATNEFTIQLL